MSDNERISEQIDEDAEQGDVEAHRLAQRIAQTTEPGEGNDDDVEAHGLAQRVGHTTEPGEESDDVEAHRLA